GGGTRRAAPWSKGGLEMTLMDPGSRRVIRAVGGASVTNALTARTALASGLRGGLQFADAARVQRRKRRPPAFAVARGAPLGLGAVDLQPVGSGGQGPLVGGLHAAVLA